MPTAPRKCDYTDSFPSPSTIEKSAIERYKPLLTETRKYVIDRLKDTYSEGSSVTFPYKLKDDNNGKGSKLVWDSIINEAVKSGWQVDVHDDQHDGTFVTFSKPKANINESTRIP